MNWEMPYGSKSIYTEIKPYRNLDRTIKDGLTCWDAAYSKQQ
ncbi:MAG: hypothetical protein QXR39_01435 [Candidatus Methanomethylicia archaeon]